LKIKIFEPKAKKHIIDTSNLINRIIDNDLSLEEKMTFLCNSYSEVKLTPNGENELIQKIINKLGGNVYFPRKGDNNERFDAIIDFPNKWKCVVEIEIPSTAILDAPRNLLDDYAVLKSRSIETDVELHPLVICWDLPNKRTDYWNVILDIQNVLNIKIKTISVLALAVHYWTGTQLDLSRDYYLNANKNSMDMISTILENNGVSVRNFTGYFSPYK
jgi:hypothetical protein